MHNSLRTNDRSSISILSTPGTLSKEETVLTTAIALVWASSQMSCEDYQTTIPGNTVEFARKTINF